MNSRRSSSASSISAGTGRFCGGVIVTGDINDGWATGFTELLPYLEQQNLRNLYHMDRVWYDEVNERAVGTQVKVFYCPSNRLTGGPTVPETR